MAKRFTDTNKYKKSFIRSLPGAYKLLWDFLYHDCDHAGIWIVDFQIAQMYVGKDMKITKTKAIELFNQSEIKIVELDGGKKWFIPSFIEFQYGQLSEKNAAHKNVLFVLRKYNLLSDDLKPLYSPFEGAKEKEEYKEEEMDKEMEEDFGKCENLLIPKMAETWKKHKPKYPADKKKDYKPLLTIAQFICTHEKVDFDVGNTDAIQKVLEIWSMISEFISTHNFYKNHSLQQVERYIQSITQEIQNGTTKNGKQAGSKISGSGLHKAFDKFYQGGKSA